MRPYLILEMEWNGLDCRLAKIWILGRARSILSDRRSVLLLGWMDCCLRYLYGPQDCCLFQLLYTDFNFHWQDRVSSKNKRPIEQQMWRRERSYLSYRLQGEVRLLRHPICSFEEFFSLRWFLSWMASWITCGYWFGEKRNKQVREQDMTRGHHFVFVHRHWEKSRFDWTWYNSDVDRFPPVLTTRFRKWWQGEESVILIGGKCWRKNETTSASERASETASSLARSLCCARQKHASSDNRVHRAVMTRGAITGNLRQSKTFRVEDTSLWFEMGLRNDVSR